jgi:hypothetical protein
VFLVEGVGAAENGTESTIFDGREQFGDSSLTEK